MANATHQWKFHNGSHFYCRCNVLGYTEQILGTVVPVEGEIFVGCLNAKFDTYQEYADLTAAQNHIMAITALENENGKS